MMISPKLAATDRTQVDFKEEKYKVLLNKI